MLTKLLLILTFPLWCIPAYLNVRHMKSDQQLMKKSPEALIGERFNIKREGQKDVSVNLYMLKDGQKHPLVVNIHGGGFVYGDADSLDTQSARISKEWQVNVVSPNYTLADAGNMEEGVVYQLVEIIDTVKHFASHAEDFGVSPDNIFLMGYSAGGYLAMASVISLLEENIPIKGQIICYGLTANTTERFKALPKELKEKLPPSLFVLAGKDDAMNKGQQEYIEAIRSEGRQADVVIYDNALHGFMEQNDPETEKLYFKDARSPEQERLAKEAEREVGAWLKKHLAL